MNSFQMAQLIARAWMDPGFKARLLDRPAEAIKECEIELPEGLTLKVHVNSQHEMHMVLPDTPVQMDQVAPRTSDAENDGGCMLPCRGDNSW